VSDLLELPFDQFQRYRLAADLLGSVRRPGKAWRILDVGGRTGLLRRFLPEDKVELVDLEPSGEPGLVLGDGARPCSPTGASTSSPPSTRSSTSPGMRDAFVAECRLATSYVAIVGYRHPEVDEAERLVQVFPKEARGRAPLPRGAPPPRAARTGRRVAPRGLGANVRASGTGTSRG
jgi:hypothetical protein